MKSFFSYLLIFAGLSQALPSPFPEAQAEYDRIRAKTTEIQKAILQKRTSGCTWDNVVVRREWSTLTLAERKEWTDAVHCLRRLPPITPPEVAPGARSRFDDIHASHINQTLWVHLSTYFLPWHRYFVHAWEKALRDECGYTGGQPYWDWSAGDSTPGNNALFSGEGSIGGNGEAIEHEPSTVYVPTVPQSVGRIPPGTGGGCIIDGPFANMTNNLGPQGPPTVSDAFEYHPRCIRRDFRPGTTNTSLTYANVTNLLAQTDLHKFTSVIEGMHPKGHAGIGGMNDDLYAGNGDPAFYFHHSQVDHMWNLWQTLDRDTRLWQVTQTLTISNSPPSANGTLDTTMDLGYNGGTYAMRDLVSTIDGPFCYIYE